MRYVDKQHRSIQIVCDGLNIKAFHKSKRIGVIEFDVPDGHLILYGMEVDKAYGRAGIATAMMKHAVKIHGVTFGKPGYGAVGGNDANPEDWYTQDGAALIQHCIESGILPAPDETDVDLDESSADQSR